MTGRRLEVVPCGAPDRSNVELVVGSLAETYDVEVSVAQPRPLPEDAFDPSREQYRAEALLFETGSDGRRRVTVTDVDLYYHQRNYVFGLAALEADSAVFSTYRLRGEAARLTESRIRKQAIKQGARVLGLEGCSDHCAIAHAATVADLDALPASLCATCRDDLSVGVAGPTPDAEATEPTGVARRAVAPTKADIDDIERSGESDADRKDVGEQVVDEVAATARFVGWLVALAGSFLLVGAGLFWLVEDVAGMQLGSVGEYALLAVTLLLTVYTARTVVRLGQTLVAVARS